MAASGEEKSIFVGLRNSVAQALPDAAKQAGRFVSDTASRVARCLTAHAVTEADITNDLERIAKRPPNIALRLGGGVRATLDAARAMSSKVPTMGWKAFRELTPKARNLTRALEQDGVKDIRPGEVGTTHLAELTRYTRGEVAVVQGPAGDLKLIKGQPTITTIPDELLAKGYRFTVHTHPEDRIPGEHTDLDRARGIRNSMTGDLTARANGTARHIEAVVNRKGEVTYFDHTGILSLGGTSLPGGPINHLGFVVPVEGM
jgi:hypothetical protein